MGKPSVFGALASALSVKAPSNVTDLSVLNPPTPGGGGWWPVVREAFPGAWQRNIELKRDLVLANWAVFSCITRITNDIGKLRLRLVERKASGIWEETKSAAFSPVLAKPNHYQTRQKFIEAWLLSKLIHGNTYVLKERDARGVVVRLYVLDGQRVKPLVAPDGAVYYSLCDDVLAGLQSSVPAIPASEIMHDVMYALFHPLCGISPLFACSLPAAMGLKMQDNAARFFANQSQPGGIITAPEAIDDDTAKRIKDHWEAGYTGVNAGRVAVLGDGMKYEAMTTTFVDSDMVSMMKLTGLMVCSTYHMPPFKVGLEQLPAGQKVGDMNQIYYNDCLQPLTESIETLLDEGLGLDTPKEGVQMGTEFDLDDLMKMDEPSQISTLNESVKGGWLKPNEARRRRNLAPVAGGDTPYMQQQNFALSDLARRSELEDPFSAGKAAPAPPPAPAPEPPADDGDEEADDVAKAFGEALIARLTAATAET